MKDFIFHWYPKDTMQKVFYAYHKLMEKIKQRDNLCMEKLGSFILGDIGTFCVVKVEKSKEAIEGVDK
jgi:hypothetical protein